MENKKEQLGVLESIWISLKESGHTILKVLKDNIGNIGTLLVVLLPYLYSCCMGLNLLENPFLLPIPIIILYISYILRKAQIIRSNRTLDNIPIPKERFTTVDEDGVITVDETKVQDLLIYISELEDALEYKLGELK